MTNSSGITQVILMGLAIILGVWIIRRLWLWLLLGAVLFLFIFHGSCPAATSTIGLTG